MFILAPLLSACSSSPPKPAPPDARLSDIRSDATERALRLIPEGPITPRGIATFQRIDLPLNRSTDAAWAVVDETAFPALTRGVWNANGLRAGLLPRHKVADFVKALPHPEGWSHDQLLASDHKSPIVRTPRLKGFVTIDLTVPPGAVREERISGGRLQLLTRLSTDARGAMLLDLFPHQFLPKLTLQPRDPLEKELDGRIFNELAVRVEMPRSQVLVIGLYRPWPVSQPEEADLNAPPPPVPPELLAAHSDDEAPTAPAGERADAEQAGAEREALPEEHATSQAIEAPPLPNHLGRALFASLRRGRTIQTVLLVTVEPLESPTPRYAPPPAAATPMAP